MLCTVKITYLDDHVELRPYDVKLLKTELAEATNGLTISFHRNDDSIGFDFVEDVKDVEIDVSRY